MLFSSEDLVAIVVTLSFAAGLNVYATVLSLGVMARLHWVTLPAGLEAVEDTWILVASGVLFVVEFFADKIPGFDLVWNALHTFVRVPVAALLAYAAGSHLSPGKQMVLTGVGALVAAIAHGSKTALRVAVTPSPEPVSNIALSSGEDAAAVGLSWVALHHPVSVGVSVACVSVIGVGLVWKSMRVLRGMLGRMGRWWSGVRVVR